MLSSRGTISRFVRGRTARAFAAVLGAALAFLLRQALAQKLPGLPPYILFFPVVLTAALWGGLWNGILATGLSALLTDVWVLAPIGRFSVAQPSDAAGLALFSICGVSAAAIAEFYRRSRAGEQCETQTAERRRGPKAAAAQLAADPSSRRRAEQGIGENRAKLEAVLASMTDSILITDAEGRFVDFNDAFAKFYRFKSKEECARNFTEFAAIFDVMMGDGTPAPQDMFATRRALRGETVANAEYILRRKDSGETWTGSLSFGPIRDQYGAIAGAVITVRDITGAKRDEARLRRFYETDLFAILYWKIDGGVIDVNDKFLDMTGYSREDVKAGRVNWAKITPPEYQALDEDARRQVRETGIHRPYEKEFIRKDGERVWGLFWAAAYEDDREQGVSVIYDITSRKRAETALAETRLQAERSAAQLRTIFDSVEERLYVCDAAGKVIMANDVSRRTYGEHNGAPPAGEMGNFIAVSDLDGHPLPEPEWPIARVLRGEPVKSAEVRVRFKTSGEERILSCNGSAIRDQSGNIMMAVLTSADVTERRRAEDDLRRAKREWERTFDSVPDLIAILDKKRRIVRMNRALSERLGTTAQGCIGASCFECMHSAATPPDNCPFPFTLQDGLQHVEEVHEERLGGDFLVSTSPLFDERGELDGVVHVARDITDRKQAEAALLRSERETLQREQLRALADHLQRAREQERKMVARDLHDQIGQILTAIRIDMACVVRRLAPSESEMHSRLARAMKLVADGVQSVRRICSGLRPGILDDLGLTAAIEWQAKEFEARTGISCQISIPSEDLEVDGDRATAIFRIFQECLTNVMRHAEARSVCASLYQEDESVILVVKDDGKGFSEAGVPGSLGLLGMKERAEVCGGDLRISSSPGNGTTVNLRVPLHSACPEGEKSCTS